MIQFLNFRSCLSVLKFIKNIETSPTKIEENFLNSTFP